MHALMNLIRYSGIPLSKLNTNGNGTSTSNTSNTANTANSSATMTPVISNNNALESVSVNDYELSLEHPDSIPSTPLDEIDLDYLANLFRIFTKKSNPTTTVPFPSVLAYQRCS